MIVVPIAKQRVSRGYLREKACHEREAHTAADSTASLQAGKNCVRLQVEDRTGKDLCSLDVIGQEAGTQEQIVLECCGILRPQAGLKGLDLC